MNERGIKFKKLFIDKRFSRVGYPIVKEKTFDFASKSYARDNSFYFNKVDTLSFERDRFG